MDDDLCFFLACWICFVKLKELSTCNPQARHLNTPVVIVSSELNPWSKTGRLLTGQVVIVCTLADSIWSRLPMCCTNTSKNPSDDEWLLFSLVVRYMPRACIAYMCINIHPRRLKESYVSSLTLTWGECARVHCRYREGVKLFQDWATPSMEQFLTSSSSGSGCVHDLHDYDCATWWKYELIWYHNHIIIDILS